MKRLSNAGDKIQTVAIMIFIIGSLLIIGLYLFVIYNCTGISSASKFVAIENNDGSVSGSIIAMLTDKGIGAGASIEYVLVVSMVISLLKLWFWALILYAFGELCENVYDINHSSRVTFYDEYERYKESKDENPAITNALTNNPALDSQKVWKCKNCGNINMFSNQNCVSCGQKKP